MSRNYRPDGLRSYPLRSRTEGSSRMVRNRSPVKRIRRDRQNDSQDLEQGNSSATVSNYGNTGYQFNGNSAGVKIEDSSRHQKKRQKMQATDVYENSCMEVERRSEDSNLKTSDGQDSSSANCEDLFNNCCDILELQHFVTITNKAFMRKYLTGFDIEIYEGSHYWEQIEGDYLLDPDQAREVAFAKGCKFLVDKFGYEIRHRYASRNAESNLPIWTEPRQFSKLQEVNAAKSTASRSEDNFLQPQNVPISAGSYPWSGNNVRTLEICPNNQYTLPEVKFNITSSELPPAPLALSYPWQFLQSSPRFVTAQTATPQTIPPRPSPPPTEIISPSQLSKLCHPDSSLQPPPPQYVWYPPPPPPEILSQPCEPPKLCHQDLYLQPPPPQYVWYPPPPPSEILSQPCEPPKLCHQDSTLQPPLSLYVSYPPPPPPEIQSQHCQCPKSYQSDPTMTPLLAPYFWPPPPPMNMQSQPSISNSTEELQLLEPIYRPPPMTENSFQSSQLMQAVQLYPIQQPPLPQSIRIPTPPPPPPPPPLPEVEAQPPKWNQTFLAVISTVGETIQPPPPASVLPKPPSKSSERVKPKQPQSSMQTTLPQSFLPSEKTSISSSPSMRFSKADKRCTTPEDTCLPSKKLSREPQLDHKPPLSKKKSYFSAASTTPRFAAFTIPKIARKTRPTSIVLQSSSIPKKYANPEGKLSPLTTSVKACGETVLSTMSPIATRSTPSPSMSSMPTTSLSLNHSTPTVDMIQRAPNPTHTPLNPVCPPSLSPQPLTVTTIQSAPSLSLSSIAQISSMDSIHMSPNTLTLSKIPVIPSPPVLNTPISRVTMIQLPPNPKPSSPKNSIASAHPRSSRHADTTSVMTMVQSAPKPKPPIPIYSILSTSSRPTSEILTGNVIQSVTSVVPLPSTNSEVPVLKTTTSQTSTVRMVPLAGRPSITDSKHLLLPQHPALELQTSGLTMIKRAYSENEPITQPSATLVHSGLPPHTNPASPPSVVTKVERAPALPPSPNLVLSPSSRPTSQPNAVASIPSSHSPHCQPSTKSMLSPSPRPTSETSIGTLIQTDRGSEPLPLMSLVLSPISELIPETATIQIESANQVINSKLTASLRPTTPETIASKIERAPALPPSPNLVLSPSSRPTSQPNAVASIPSSHSPNCQSSTKSILSPSSRPTSETSIGTLIQTDRGSEPLPLMSLVLSPISELIPETATIQIESAPQVNNSELPTSITPTTPEAIASTIEGDPTPKPQSFCKPALSSSPASMNLKQDSRSHCQLPQIPGFLLTSFSSSSLPIRRPPPKYFPCSLASNVSATHTLSLSATYLRDLISQSSRLLPPSMSSALSPARMPSHTSIASFIPPHVDSTVALTSTSEPALVPSTTSPPQKAAVPPSRPEILASVMSILPQAQEKLAEECFDASLGTEMETIEPKVDRIEQIPHPGFIPFW